MDFAPNTRDILVHMVRRKLRQHRYDPNLDNALSRLPVVCNLDQHPTLIAIREMEKMFDNDDRAVVMEAFWSNDCRLVGMDKACKTFRATLKKIIEAGLCWKTIVRILVIATVLGDQFFKERQIDRIVNLIEWTLKYFSENHIEAWIAAGDNGWNDLIECVFEVVEEPSYTEQLPEVDDESYTSSDDCEEYDNFLLKPASSNNEPKICPPAKPENKLPVKDMDPDMEYLVTAKNHPETTAIKIKEAKKNPEYFKRLPRLDRNGDLELPSESGESTAFSPKSPVMTDVNKSKALLHDAKSRVEPDRQTSALPVHGSTNHNTSPSRSAVMTNLAPSRSPMASPSHGPIIRTEPPSEIKSGEKSFHAQQRSQIIPSKSQPVNAGLGTANSRTPVVNSSTAVPNSDGESEQSRTDTDDRTEDTTRSHPEQLPSSNIQHEDSSPPSSTAMQPKRASLDKSPSAGNSPELRKKSMSESPSRPKPNGRPRANQGSFNVEKSPVKRQRAASDGITIGAAQIKSFTVGHSPK